MGHYAKITFGQESFGDVGVIVAGTIIEQMEAAILGYFDSILSSKDQVYHAHLVRSNDVAYPIAFNVYGAPALIDLLALMHDGGCRNVIFVGFAGGYQSLEVGDVTLPDRSYHLDGIYKHIEPDRTVSFADDSLKQQLQSTLASHSLALHHGANISVPAVTLQPSVEVRHRLKPLTVEMELAACYSRAQELGMRAAGALVITDSKNHQFASQQQKPRDIYRARHLQVMKAVVTGLNLFSLPPLPVEQPFDLADYFANYEY